MTKTTFIAAAVLTAAGLALSACGGGETPSSANYPGETLELAIPGGPGGGNDLMARTLAQILTDEKIYPEQINPTNRLTAGGGTTAWQDVFDAKGDPYEMATTSSSFILMPLDTQVNWTPDQFTPVALLAQDDSLIVTLTEDGHTDWESWLAHAKGGSGVKVGGVGHGSDLVRQVSLAEQAGYKADYVPFSDDGEVINALLSGSVDAIISSPGKILGQVDAGKMSAILWTGAQPLTAAPGAVTATSLGYKALPGTPRGLVLPPGVDPKVVEWWRGAIAKVVETDEWKSYLTKNNLTPDVRYGADFGSFLKETTEEFKRILAEQGQR